MFCGMGHMFGCQCEVCLDRYRYRPVTRPWSKGTIRTFQVDFSLGEWMRRPMPGDRSGPADADFNDPGLKREYPTLYEYLSLTRYEKGESRVTSTLLIFVENGVLRICLNDRDNNRSVFFTGETLECALASLEAALLSDRVEWRTRNSSYNRDPKTPF